MKKVIMFVLLILVVNIVKAQYYVGHSYSFVIEDIKSAYPNAECYIINTDELCVKTGAQAYVFLPTSANSNMVNEYIVFLSRPEWTNEVVGYMNKFGKDKYEWIDTENQLKIKAGVVPDKDQCYITISKYYGKWAPRDRKPKF